MIISSFFFFLQFGRVRGKWTHYIRYPRIFKPELFFRVLQKKENGECRSLLFSSMTTVLEAVRRYSFVEPYYFRVSVSSQTRSLYAWINWYFLPSCLFRINKWLSPSFPPFLLSFPPSFLYSLLFFKISILDLESWYRVLFYFYFWTQ